MKYTELERNMVLIRSYMVMSGLEKETQHVDSRRFKTAQWEQVLLEFAFKYSTLRIRSISKTRHKMGIGHHL